MKYIVYRQLVLVSITLFSLIGCSDSGSADQVSNTYTPVPDTQAPAAIELHIQTIDTRLPSVELTWKAVGDDGSVGAADHYDIRFARTPITEGSWAGSCPVTDITYTLPPTTPLVFGGDERFVVRGPDEKAADDPCRFITEASVGTYYFAVRAVDEVGNISALEPQSVVSVDTLHIKTQEIILGDDFKAAVLNGSSFANYMTTEGALIGDVDGDGLEDLLFGSYLVDGVCLVYGAEVRTSVTLHQLCDDDNNISGDGCDLLTKREGLRYTCVVGADNIITGATKFATALKGLGDINGDGFDDFGISGELNTEGFVAIYLGRATGLLLNTPNIIVKNATPTAIGNYFSFCEAGNFTAESTALGLSIDSFAVGEPGIDTLHVIDGNSSWSSSTQLTIDLDNIAASNNILTIKGIASLQTQMGYLCTSTGSIIGPKPGLLFSTTVGTATTLQQVILMEGISINGHETVPLHIDMNDVNGSGLDNKVARFTTNASLSTSSDFGNYFLGNYDIDGDGMAEVIITQPEASQAHGGNGLAVQIFDGASLTSEVGGAPTYLTQLVGPIGNAWLDYNGWLTDTLLSHFFRDSITLIEWDWPTNNAHTLDLISINADYITIHLDQDRDDGTVSLGMYPYDDIQIKTSLNNAWISAGRFERADKPTIIYGTLNGKIGLIH